MLLRDTADTVHAVSASAPWFSWEEPFSFTEVPFPNNITLPSSYLTAAGARSDPPRQVSQPPLKRLGALPSLISKFQGL